MKRENLKPYAIAAAAFILGSVAGSLLTIWSPGWIEVLRGIGIAVVAFFVICVLTALG